MSAVKALGALVFASAVLAAGHGRHGHQNLHRRYADVATDPSVPECWTKCFGEHHIESDQALCGNDAVSQCIEAAGSEHDVTSYQTWLEHACAVSPLEASKSVAGVHSSSSAEYVSFSSLTAAVEDHPVPTTAAPYPLPHSNNTASPPPQAPPSYEDNSSVESHLGSGDEMTTILSTSTSTSTFYQTTTVYAAASESSDAPVGSPQGTLYAAASDSPNASAGSPQGAAPVHPAGGAPTCAAEVTVTTTEKTTVYVTAGQAAPAFTSAPAPEKYHAQDWSHESPAPASTSASAPEKVHGQDATHESPAPTAPANPSSKQPDSSQGSSKLGTDSSTPSKPQTPVPGSGFRSKRAILYDARTPQYVTPVLANSPKLGWTNNWEGASKLPGNDIPFIPTLHGPDSVWTDAWKAQVEAAKGTSKYLFFFNEPDLPGQSLCSPTEAVDYWVNHMEPHKNDFLLCAPGVSSAAPGAGMGMDWINEFEKSCKDQGKTCTIGCYNQHWYNSDGNLVDNFKERVQNAMDKGKPVFVGEFGATGSDAERAAFMEEVMPWMDSQDQIVGYGYYMAAPGHLTEGDELNAQGTFAPHFSWTHRASMLTISCRQSLLLVDFPRRYLTPRSMQNKCCQIAFFPWVGCTFCRYHTPAAPVSRALDSDLTSFPLPWIGDILYYNHGSTKLSCY